MGPERIGAFASFRHIGKTVESAFFNCQLNCNSKAMPVTYVTTLLQALPSTAIKQKNID